MSNQHGMAEWVTSLGDAHKSVLSQVGGQGYVCESLSSLWDLGVREPAWRQKECVSPHASQGDVPAPWRIVLRNNRYFFLCKHCMKEMPPEVRFTAEVLTFIGKYLPTVTTHFDRNADYPLILRRPKEISFVSWEEAESFLEDQATREVGAWKAFKVLRASAQDLMDIWYPPKKLHADGVKAVDPSHVRLLPGCDNADQSMHKAISRGMLDLDYLRGVWPEFRELHELSLKSYLHVNGVPARVRELQQIVLPRMAVLMVAYGNDQEVEDNG